MSGDVVRVWNGYGSTDGVQRYCDQHFNRVVLPQLRRLHGFLGATLLVRTRERGAQVVVMTRWASIDAIHQFAGTDYEQAVVEPAVRELLDDFDERVEHFSVALETDADGGRDR
jgi:heme-degrading monooxygenase HmoA